jgi:NitT/TauT family transport system ATP-binding protein
MAYIVVVNPQILAQAGMPPEGVVFATCISAAAATLVMGLYANYPIALAPGMSLNAYFTYSVCIGMHIPWRTALGNVTFGLEMKGIGKAEREEIALRQLRLVKLEKFVQSYPHHLSGGMQQRVAIARALAYNPSVLLMDEPFAALDALTRDDMQRLLADVWRETRKTVIYVTHNVAEAVYLADRVVVMTPHPGRVKIELPIPLARPRDPLSVDFLEYQKSLLQHLGQQAVAAVDAKS